MSGDVYETYKRRRAWARDVANRLKVNLSEGEEFFEVPIYDDEGKETRVEHIPTRINVPIIGERGVEVASIPPDEAVEAIKKYPNESLLTAWEKLKAENEKQKTIKK